MENSKSLLTISYRLDSAERFISSVADNQYYFFVGNHLNSNTVARPFDNPKDTLLSVYYGMIFGKKVNENDVSLMIRRIDWESGISYDKYDHSDPFLNDRDFYVVVKEGTQYDVFKCLENGHDGPSTVAPSRTNVSVNGEDFYYPTDGYRWKYMYSVSEAVADKFATTEYFPVVVDAGVSSKAVKGAIDVIAVEDEGKGYANYFNGQFGVGDIRLNGDPKKYGISTKGIKNSNGFYDACWLYISSGPGAGQFRMIESYTSNATHNFVELVSAFDSSDAPQNGSVFEISPSIEIKGDGEQTTDAKARAIIDPEGNTVNRVEMLDRGKDYNLASAYVMAASSVGVTANAQIVPIYSPFGGHGYHAPTELGSKYVGIGVKLQGTEGNTVITDNDYSQIGLIKNPQFRKVGLSLTDQNRDFYTNELVYKIDPVQVLGAVNTILNGNNELTTGLTANGMVASKTFRVGDSILLEYTSNYQLANVVAVSNTTVTMDKAALFDTGTGTANVYLANPSSVGLVDGYSVGDVILTNVNGEFAVDDFIIGAETGTKATVTQVEITDVQKSFSTFIQCHTYIGDITSGTFLQDEQVFQVANAVTNAKFHSMVDDTLTGSKRIYVTNQIGVFNTSADGINLSSEIIGYTSGAIGNLTNKYLPDLVFGSGEILYVENGDAITRSSEESETFKLVIEF